MRCFDEASHDAVERLKETGQRQETSHMLTKGYPASTQFEKAAANLINNWRSWEVMHQTNCGVGKGEEGVENGYVDALTW